MADLVVQAMVVGDFGIGWSVNTFLMTGAILQSLLTAACWVLLFLAVLGWRSDGQRAQTGGES